MLCPISKKNWQIWVRDYGLYYTVLEHIDKGHICIRCKFQSGGKYFLYYDLET